MIKNFAKLLSFSSMAMLCTFLFQTYATHVLSPKEYGILARWLTDLNYFGLFLVFGLDNALLYFTKREVPYSDNIVRNFTFFSLVGISALVFLWLNERVSWYSVTLILSIMTFAAYQSLNAYNQLRERYARYGSFVLLKPLSLLLVLVGLSVLNEISDAVDVFVAYLLVGLSLLMALGALCLYETRMTLPRPIFCRSYFGYGAKSMFNTLLAVSLYTSTVYCIDYLQGKEAVGYFFIASAVAKLAWVLPDAVGNIMYPRFLKIGFDYKKELIMAEAYKLSRIVVVANFLAVLFFIAIGQWLVDLLFGDDFAEGVYSIIIILLIGNQGMVLYKILGRYLASINSWRIMHVALAVSLASNVLLNFLLNPIWGVQGSAIATSMSFWLCGLIVSLRVPGSLTGFFSIHKLLELKSNG